MRYMKNNPKKQIQVTKDRDAGLKIEQLIVAI